MRVFYVWREKEREREHTHCCDTKFALSVFSISICSNPFVLTCDAYTHMYTKTLFVLVTTRAFFWSLENRSLAGRLTGSPSTSSDALDLKLERLQQQSFKMLSNTDAPGKVWIWVFESYWELPRYRTIETPYTL